MKKIITKETIKHAKKILSLHKEQKQRKEREKRRLEANGDPCYGCGMIDRCGDCRRLTGRSHSRF